MSAATPTSPSVHSTKDVSTRDRQVARFHQLDVEGFTLSDGNGGTRHYKRDHDLLRLDLLGSGSQQAAVLVGLGIDDNDCDTVALDFNPAHFEDGGALEVITEAIETLELIRSQLEAIESTPEARKSARNAFELGVDAQSAGLLDHRKPA